MEYLIKIRCKRFWNTIFLSIQLISSRCTMPSYKDEKTGKWYCQFWYTDWHNEKKHKTKRGFSRKKDADAWELSFKNKEQHQSITMNILAKDFILDMENKQKLGSLKITTVKHKTNMIDLYVLPFFNGVNIDKIQERNITEWLTNINNSSNTESKKLSSSTLGIIRNLLSQMFNFAIRNYGIQKNPVNSYEKIPYLSNDKRAKLWTVEQYSTFYSHLKKDRHKVIFNLMFFAGLRIGEVLGLRKCDISKYSVSVKETLTRIKIDKTEFMKGTPKSKSSTRTTQIPMFLYEQLQAYISTIYDVTETNRLFPVSFSSIDSALRYWQKKLGLPKISPHTLRHSYASIRYNLTKDFATVASSLGHSNPSITAKVYSHALPNENRKGLDELELLNPSNNKNNQDKS